jgi:hypothetical protein
MRNCFCIILFLVLGLTLPAVSVYAYGGGGGGEGSGGSGGDPMIDIENTSSDPTKPPSGFETTKPGSAASETTISSETDPGKEEEVAELVEEVNLMEETEETSKPSAPYWTVGAHISSWILSNPVKAWRDSVVNRVPRGECCVDASKDRAADIAAHLQSLVDSGELDLGDCRITIGSRSGYKVPLSGWLSGLEENIGTHTYTVVQIYDADGNFQGAWEADTYVANIVLPHSEVDLVKEYPGHVKTVAPGKKGNKS